MQQDRRDLLARSLALALGHFSVANSARASEGNPLTPDQKFQLLDQANVFAFMSEAQRDDVRSGRGQIDVTAPVQACLDAAAGKKQTVHFPAGTYLLGRVFPRSDTNLWLDGKTVWRKAVKGVSLLRVANADNVHIFANGARFDGSGADPSSSHTIYFDSARRCSIRDANVFGAGERKDCIYVGEGNRGPCEDLLILGGSCVGARRNGISVVSGFRTIIDGVEITGTTGAPGAGIDVESNVYGRAVGTEIRNCRIHGNQTYGIVVVFGQDVRIHHNEVFGNLKDGIGAAAGGYQFERGVYRSNVDVRGVAGFRQETGHVLVGGRADTLPVGSVVLFQAGNGATLPSAFAASRRWVVNEVRQAASGAEILLGGALDYDVTRELADSGSGRTNADPALSDIRLICHVEGQSSGIKIHDNVVSGNLRRGISMITSVNVSIRDNRISHGGSLSGIQVSYVRGADLRGNVVTHDGSGGGKAGILVGVCTSVSTGSNRIVGFPESGLDIGYASGTNMEADVVLNCGTRNGFPVRLRNASAMKVTGLRVANDAAHPAEYGVWADSLTQSVFRDVDASGSGRSNATSIAVGENSILNSRVRDGTTVSRRVR